MISHRSSDRLAWMSGLMLSLLLMGMGCRPEADGDESRNETREWAPSPLHDSKRHQSSCAELQQRYVDSIIPRAEQTDVQKVVRAVIEHPNGLSHMPCLSIQLPSRRPVEW